MQAGDKPIDTPTEMPLLRAVDTLRDRKDNGLDLSRLSRPQAEAFRYLAHSLGARFAGDQPDLGQRPPAPRAASPMGAEPLGSPGSPSEPTRLRAVPRCPIAHDEARENLLDRVPVAILVIVGDGISFINRAAAGLFGYTSAKILDAAGGLGALFDGQDPDEAGVLHMVAANGRRFAAKVTMATVDWGGARAMLFTVIPSADVPQPRPPERTRQPEEPRDPLVALLDANPDPIAIVSRGGEVEACNAAFENLAGERAAVRLDDRLEPDDLRHVFDVMQLSFVLADGAAQTTRPVRVGAYSFCVTVGALKNGRLACLVFHTLGTEPAAPAAPSSSPTRAA